MNVRTVRNRLTATGTPVHLAGYSEVTCAGFWYHEEFLAEFLPETVMSGDVTVNLHFALLPEPTNPFDPNAVAVSLENHHVGYLPAEIATAYLPFLTKWIGDGHVPFITGKIFARLLPANDEYSESKTRIKLYLHVENVNPPQPISTWELPGASAFASEGMGLLDHESGARWAPSEDLYVDDLRNHLSVSAAEYAFAHLVLLEAAKPTHAKRLGVEIGGRVIARLSAVVSGRYREELLAAELQGLRLLVVVRPSGDHRRMGCDVLIPPHPKFDGVGRLQANYDFAKPLPVVEFSPAGVQMRDGAAISVAFETVHTLWSC
ncbi:HIRAN domain-containing protein [Arthrobacter sp. Hz1]